MKSNIQINKKGFTPTPNQNNEMLFQHDEAKNVIINNPRSKKGSVWGFTLIELLVVVAIIGLLASVVLIALMSARQKSRNAKRLADMVQMNNALELYNTYYKGYPSSTTPTSGIPGGLIPQFMQTIPQDPMGDDGVCAGQTYPSGTTVTPPAGISTNQYYYVPIGTPYQMNGNTVYPSYYYYFCLGSNTGNFSSGIRVLTPTGVQ